MLDLIQKLIDFVLHIDVPLAIIALSVLPMVFEAWRAWRENRAAPAVAS